MKAVFEVKTLENDWKPPFRKNNSAREYSVGESEEFDRITGNGNDEAVFQLLQYAGERAQVKYSRLFTLKEPLELGGKEKTIWAPLGKEITITYLWGEKGITKKITYLGMAAQENENGQQALEQTSAINQ